MVFIGHVSAKENLALFSDIGMLTVAKPIKCFCIRTKIFGVYFSF